MESVHVSRLAKGFEGVRSSLGWRLHERGPGGASPSTNSYPRVVAKIYLASLSPVRHEENGG